MPIPATPVAQPTLEQFIKSTERPPAATAAAGAAANQPGEWAVDELPQQVAPSTPAPEGVRVGAAQGQGRQSILKTSAPRGHTRLKRRVSFDKPLATELLATEGSAGAASALLPGPQAATGAAAASTEATAAAVGHRGAGSLAEGSGSSDHGPQQQHQQPGGGADEPAKDSVAAAAGAARKEQSTGASREFACLAGGWDVVAPEVRRMRAFIAHC